MKSLSHNHRSIGLFTLLILFQLAAPLLASKANYITEIQPILQKRCYACHGPEKQKGKLRLDTISTDLINDRKAARHWQDVRSAINLGEMPPEEEPTLSADERRTVLSWLNSEIKSAADSRKSKGGRVVVRRLNRT
ncbi:MAG: c-type cytochrome domain-containing protein [Akkermansiaceae bacterium]